MRKTLLFIFYIVFSNIAFGQSPLAGHLRTLESFEDRLEFFMFSNISLDSLNFLLERTTNDRDRLELLLFHIAQQFKKNASKGEDNCIEALKLAKKYNLEMHIAKSYLELATLHSFRMGNDTTLIYLDSAMTIAMNLEDKIIESYVYGVKSFYYTIREDQSKKVKNLLKSAELADEYARPAYKNLRIIRLVQAALAYKNNTLPTKFLDKVNVDYLDDLRLIDFFNLKIELFIRSGMFDSAQVYMQKSLDIEFYTPLANYMFETGNLDSALVLYQMEVDIKDPESSYFEILFYQMAQIYIQKGMYDSAEVLLKKCTSEALRLNESLNESKSYVDLASFYLHQKKMKSNSQEYCKKAYEIAKKNDFTTIQIQSLSILSYISALNKDFEEAYLYNEEFLRLNSKSKEQEANELFQIVEIEQDMENWSMENTKKLQNANDTKNAFIGFFLVSVALLIWLWYLYRLKKKRLETELYLTQTIQAKNSEIRAQREGLKIANEKLEDLNGGLEERINERTNEIEEVNNALIGYNHRIEQYASLTSHNLRAPLANIKGLTNLYTSMPHDYDKNFIMDHILASTNEIEEVTEELSSLMDVTKRSQFVIEKIDLNLFASQLEKWTRDHLSDEINFKYYISVSEISTVYSFLFRSLTELISNANTYKHVNRKLELKMVISSYKSKVKISLEDNGIGIDLKKYKSNIFKLHQRIHRNSGRGIGLYLVNRQIEAIGGKISLESTLNKGTVFLIEL